MKKFIAKLLVQHYRANYYYVHSEGYLRRLLWAKQVLGEEIYEAILHKPTR